MRQLAGGQAIEQPRGLQQHKQCRHQHQISCRAQQVCALGRVQQAIARALDGRAQGGKRCFLRIQRYIGRAAIIAHLRARHAGHAQQRLLHARLAVGAGHAADDQAFGRRAHCRPFFQLAKAALACLSAAAGMVMVSASVW